MTAAMAPMPAGVLMKGGFAAGIVVGVWLYETAEGLLGAGLAAGSGAVAVLGVGAGILAVDTGAGLSVAAGLGAGAGAAAAVAAFTGLTGAGAGLVAAGAAGFTAGAAAGAGAAGLAAAAGAVLVAGATSPQPASQDCGVLLETVWSNPSQVVESVREVSARVRPAAVLQADMSMERRGSSRAVARLSANQSCLAGMPAQKKAVGGVLPAMAAISVFRAGAS